MAFTAPIRDSHLFVGVNDQIGSVKPPRGVSKRGRIEELAKVIKCYSPVKIWITEDRSRSIERRGIAPVQDSDSLRCHRVDSHGPANNQHCEGNTHPLHLVPPWHRVIPSKRISTRRNVCWL